MHIEFAQDKLNWPVTEAKRVALANREELTRRAARLAGDLIEDFQSNGVYECVNEGYTKGKDYVTSIVNPLSALKKLVPAERMAQAFAASGLPAPQQVLA